LICGELKRGKITSVSRELIATGRRLSSVLDQPLDFLLAGENLHPAAEDIIHLGVDHVLVVESPSFAELHPDLSVSIIAEVCRRTNPLLTLFGLTDFGRDMAPRLAARLGACACMDCIGLKIDKENHAIIQTKPVFGGNALAEWTSTTDRPHVVAMRPRTDKQAEPDPSRKGKILPIVIEAGKNEARSRLIETVHQKDGGVSMEEAKSIVAGGGGVGGTEGFGLLQELASLLGGAVGTTRVPSDENWMPKNLEIGQTGHIVSPDLYIAVGISGAPQHLAGCSGSKIIVALNKDPQAPIFREADFGIARDFRKVLPPLIQKIKRLKD
jgi:electron transfer flavoprotein alpha subunit